MKVRPLCGCLFLLGLWTAASAARADADPSPPPSVALQVRGCSGLASSKLREALNLELTAQPPSTWLARLTLTLTCTGKRATLDIEGQGDRPRSAELAVPEAGAGRERTLALAMSEAILAADGARRAEETHAPPSAPRPTPADVAVARVAPTPNAREHGTELGLTGALRARALGSAIRTTTVAAYCVVPMGPRWHLRLEAGFEGGASDEAVGRVRVDHGFAGVGLGQRWRWGRSTGFDVRGLALLGVARVGGHADATGVVAADVTGMTATLQAGAGPAWRLGDLWLGVEGLAGWSPPTPLGRVRVPGAERVDRSLGGAFLGVGLRGGFEL